LIEVIIIFMILNLFYFMCCFWFKADKAAPVHQFKCKINDPKIGISIEMNFK
jgi:hypothetical protein